MSQLILEAGLKRRPPGTEIVTLLFPLAGDDVFFNSVEESRKLMMFVAVFRRFWDKIQPFEINHSKISCAFNLKYAMPILTKRF